MQDGHADDICKAVSLLGRVVETLVFFCLEHKEGRPDGGEGFEETSGSVELSKLVSFLSQLASIKVGTSCVNVNDQRPPSCTGSCPS